MKANCTLDDNCPCVDCRGVRMARLAKAGQLSERSFLAYLMEQTQVALDILQSRDWPDCNCGDECDDPCLCEACIEIASALPNVSRIIKERSV